MPQPPLLPEEILARVLRLARFDGLSVLVLAALFACVMAVLREVPFAIVGLLAAGAGAVELHGVALLRRGEIRGLRWLVASQPFLLAVILGYCALRFFFFTIPPLPAGWKELMEPGARDSGMSFEQLFRLVNRVLVIVLAVVALCYQGGLAIYYWRRRKPIAEALAGRREE
jgi:hypothetical protein